MKLFIYTATVFILTNSIFVHGKSDKSDKNVYDSLILPVFAAKCQECHGENKSKGKLKLHTKKDFLKGGSGVGADIIVKGNIEESELIYRITLPKEDEEAMPPMEDSDHYNPVTRQELEVMKAWIKIGASFDLQISDLDDKTQKSAFHILANMPKKLISKNIILQPKLPIVPPASPKALNNLRKAGILAMPIAQNTNAIYVNASYAGQNFDDKKIMLLEPIAEQLVWLNLARTKVTDNGIASLTKYGLLSRLHLENTVITDKSSIHLSKLPNLEYLNLYGTQISDASLPHLQKLGKLNKLFLWQTKVTPQGAESLKKHFVDSPTYNALIAQKKDRQDSLKKLIVVETLKFEIQEEETIQIGLRTQDKTPFNNKCPVSKKEIVDEKFSIFKGRKVGFCCDKCKAKFDQDNAIQSKIPGFKASEEYLTASSNLQNARLSMDKLIEDNQQELRNINAKLYNMGPKINLGWKNPTVSKK